MAAVSSILSSRDWDAGYWLISTALDCPAFLSLTIFSQNNWGVQRVTVTQTLSSFQEEGIVRYGYAKRRSLVASASQDERLLVEYYRDQLSNAIARQIDSRPPPSSDPSTSRSASATTLVPGQDKQPQLHRLREHPDLWFLVGLGCLRLDSRNFVKRKSDLQLESGVFEGIAQVSPHRS